MTSNFNNELQCMWTNLDKHIIIKEVYAHDDDSANNQMNDTAFKWVPFIRIQKEQVNHDYWPLLLVTVWLAHIKYFSW